MVSELSAKFKLGDHVLIEHEYANHGLIHGIIREIYLKTGFFAKPGGDIRYRVNMLDYYQPGYAARSEAAKPESEISFHADYCDCSAMHLIPYSEAAKVLYGRKI